MLMNDLRKTAESMAAGVNDSLFAERVLARHWLSEHPADDDEPVTQDWLRSVGWSKEEHPQKWSAARQDGLPIGLWIVDDGWKVMLIHNENHQSCIVRGLKTRRDVRRLCEALGIELK